MNQLMLSFLLSLLMISCTQKKKEKKDPLFSVVDFLKGQVRHMDSASFVLTRIEISEGRSDTSVIPKEDFRKYAREFLEIPDISVEDKRDDYDQANNYDDVLKNVLLTYTALEPEDEIRRETVMLDFTESGDTQPRTILINRLQSGKDSTVEKDMTWHVDRRFQIVTKIRKPGKEEKIKTLILKWESLPVITEAFPADTTKQK